MPAVPLSADPGDSLVVPGWGATEWEALFACTQPIELETGAVLIQPRGDDRVLYFVASGRLDVAVIDSSGGGFSSLGSIKAGSVVGELAFFDGMPRSAKVWAVAASRLLKLSLSDFDHYAHQNPTQAAAFLFAMGRLLAHRVRGARARF